MGRTQRQRLQRRRNGIVNSTKSSDNLSSLFEYLGRLGWRNETHLTTRSFTQTGRGLCSKRALNIGEALIKMPVSALVTIATIEADVNFKDNFNEINFCEDVRIPFQSLMALYLLYQKHLASQSSLEPFINSIPSSFSTPYFCPINELHCLPEEILEKTVEHNKKIRTSFKNLQTVYRDQEYFQMHYSIADFKWMYFAVNSRCVFVPSREIKRIDGFFDSLLCDKPNLAMAPFLDLFNHSADVETIADLVPCLENNERFDFVVTLQSAPVNVQPSYSQLFISYGALTNRKLLTEYGFILPHNQHDFFEFSLHDIESLIKSEKSLDEHTFHRNKFKFIRGHNLADQMFIHLCDGASHNLLVVLHLLFKEPSYFPNILNQVAFGDVSQFDDVQDVLHKLVNFKITEYIFFIGDLKKLTVLSESGLIVLDYLQESVRYLQEYLSNY